MALFRMRALHVYPSTLEHESRILKVSGSQLRSGTVTDVFIVGTWRDGLSESEQLDEHRSLIRLRAVQARQPLARLVGFVLWSLRVFARCWRLRPSLINCHSLSVLPVCVALRWWHRARLVYEPHELETETGRLNGILKWAAVALERRLLRKADHTILVSGSIETWYRDRLGAARTSVVLNCPRTQEVTRSDYFHKLFNVPPSIPIFLYQGVLGRGRGIEILCEAFKGLEGSCALVFMGYGPSQPVVQSAVANSRNVFVHPAVEPTQILAHTAAANFGVSLIEPVSLSYEYCAPNKLFEYIMARKPVLVSPTTDQRQIVNHYGVGQVCDSLTPEGVRAAARRLMADGVDHYAANLERARKDLCWEQQEKVLMDVYRRILPHAPQESGTGEAGPS